MQIVFYSHRVNYPRALSAQGLTEKLKQAVVVKLEAMKSKVKDYEMIKKYPVLEKNYYATDPKIILIFYKQEIYTNIGTIV